MTAAPATRSAMALLLIVVFINIAGFSLILPLLPFYGQEFGASAFQVTTLFAAYSLGNVFGEIYWGRMSDRVGRKRVLAVTMACASLSYVAFAFAPNLALALAIRVVSGFFSGTLGVVQGYIADVTRPEERAQSMAHFGAAFNLGFAVGPAIGGLLAQPSEGLAGFHPPILAAALFSGVAALFALTILHDTRPKDGIIRPKPHWGEAFHFVGSNGLLTRLFVLGFIAVAGFASIEAIFGLWTEHVFGWTSRQLGLAFIAVGAAGLTAQLALVGPLVRRFGEARVIVGGMSVFIASMLLQPTLRDPIAAVILMAVLMGGHSLAFPNIGGLVSRTTPPTTQGSVLGLQMAVNASSRIFVPPLFGALYGLGNPDLPYFVCAGMMTIAVVVALQVVRIRDGQLRVPKEAIQ